jgi:hypothetical protein
MIVSLGRKPPMSFVDVLRQSRSTPTSLLHQFLTSYDPSEPRVYAFVEGDPDRAFYRAFIEQRLGSRRLYIFNCEGKRRVFDAYEKVTQRHPECRNVLFFVDKDLDDLVGQTWPNDPRIFVTEWYSVENYLANRRTVDRYFADFLKLRRVTLDLDGVSAQFDSSLADFHRAVKPLMCWIIAMRRFGESVTLSDLKLDKLFKFNGDRVIRIRADAPMSYVYRATQTSPPVNLWRQIRRVRKELDRQDSKRYIRGKFEAWFLVEFVKRVIADLVTVAAESNGSVSIATPLHESNFVQILVRGIQVPASLDSFLRFHLETAQTPAMPEQPGVGARLMGFLSRVIRGL